MSRVMVGIDEVGRGSWAGPLVVGAVILSGQIPGLRDSKQLTKRQREILAALVTAQATDYGLGWVTSEELDIIGMTAALRLGAERALAMLTAAYDDIILDGSYNFLSHIPRTRAIVRADAAVPAVSAASIIAKVARDAYMIEASAAYPGYGFERHVGYGTAAHSAALAVHGPCVLHRMSFAPVQRVIAVCT